MNNPIPVGHPSVAEILGRWSPSNDPVPAPRSSGFRWLKRFLAGLVLVGMVGGIAVLVWIGVGWNAKPTIEVPIRPVSRVDLSTVMTAAGRVDSSHKQVIACQLERLEIRNEGRAMTSGGSSMILEVIDEGSKVKKGDILCRLDSAEYEELVRTQQIKTEQSRAAFEQARLSLDVAELSIREYREGFVKLNFEDLRGQIAFDQSDLERSADRLRWTTKMLGKGYVPVAQKATAARTVAEASFNLATSLADLDLYERFGNPRYNKELESEVEKRRFEVIANTQRLARSEERLGHYQKMVDYCTIRAPQDGLVIYANDPNRPKSARLEAGVQVREQQQLFYLPDLSRMEIFTYLHESVAYRVHEGMLARARIEGLGNRILEGHVTSIAPLPVTAPNGTASDEVKFFLAVVQLDSIPQGLLPGMSAQVDIDVDRGLDVLAVPVESVAYEKGHEICYVAGIDGLERRRVTIGRSNRDLLEVTKGLADGDQVVVNPSKVQAIDAMVVNAEATPGAEESASDTARFAPSSGSGSTVE